MTDDRFGLTRRKILASLGTVGVAGAGAGLSSSAFLDDQEDFANNQLVAGELDLKIDWEEHYSYPEIYGFADPTSGVDTTRTEPGGGGYVGLPDPADPVLWVAEEDLDEYMDNTAIDAYPDDNDDGIQDSEGGDPDFPEAESICDTDSDLDEALEPSGLRTDNPDTRLADGSPAPLINLTDIKPGDFGEVTLSFHLCDNPGYVWLRAANITENENTQFGNSGGEGDLGREAKALVWYDSGSDGWDGDSDEGDNVYQKDDEDIIERGQLRDVLDVLSSDSGVLLDGNLPAEKGGGIGEQNCFDDSTTYQVGFAWWLPEEVDNVVAADSIQFDLGFDTEQCRHNDGSGRIGNTE